MKGSFMRLLPPVLLLALSGFACEEVEEGCLDRRAFNYDVSVDEACSDCCIYPQLQLTVRNQITQGDTSLSLQYGQPYVDDFGNAFRFDLVQLYISNLTFVLADGTEIGTDEQIDLPTLNSQGDTVFLTIADNFMLFPGDVPRTSSPGTSTRSGSVQKSRLLLGLTETINETIPEALPEGHPLSPQFDSMYLDQDQGYIYYRLRLFRDTIPADTIPLDIQITTPERFELEFDTPVEWTPGFNLRLTLNLNYAAWFSGLDVRNDPVELLEDKLVANLPTAFSVFSIEINDDRVN